MAETQLLIRKVIHKSQTMSATTDIKNDKKKDEEPTLESKQVVDFTKNEKIYMKLCYYLGVKIFKKYYPNNGSYWNNSHIDKKNEVHLNTIIHNAYENLKLHLAGIFIETIMILTLGLTGYLELVKSFQYFPMIFLIHGYPSIVQKYNIILANNCLKNLPPTSKHIPYKELAIGYLTISESGNNFYLRDTSYRQVGPAFINEEKAKDFAKFITENYTDEELLEHKFLDNCVKIYLKWKDFCTVKKSTIDEIGLKVKTN